MRRVHIRVYGRVQGVFFRHNTKKIADKLGVMGWVRNNPDNTVEIVAEGNNDAIEKLLDWCRKGPIGAKVDKIDVKEEDFKEEFSNFSVIY